MSFDLGDPVPLSIAITDPAGAPANAGQVDLTVTLPDGTTVPVGPISPTTVGVYDHDFPTTQAGRHNVRWVASGVNASAFRDAFDVEPEDGGAFISLADARQHLRLSGEDDERLRPFVDTGCRMITDRMGAVSPITVVADLSARKGVLILPQRPVITVISVQRLPGLATVPAADLAAGTPGYTLDSPEGVLSISGWTGMVRITTMIGRSPVPTNFRLAGLELIAHLWRGSQHNGAGGRPSLGDGDALAVNTRAFAMPFRVMELLGLKKTQERDEVFVG